MRNTDKRRIRVLGAASTVAVHLVVLAALLWPRAVPPRPRVTPTPIMVSLIEAPKPPSPRDTALKPKDIARFNAFQPAALHLALPVMVMATIAPPPDTSDLLTQSQLAGATSAGDGGNGGGCDTARLVEQALRDDPLVRKAVQDAHRAGMAILLWNGDWVRSGAQDGKGLSAVREAIIWKVAFAPEACRNKPEHGLVLLSLADGGTRFAIGTADWRWSDLLGVRGIRQTH